MKGIWKLGAHYSMMRVMLFNPKHQKKIQLIWGVLATIVIVSMILLYFPVFQA
jgi:hypothetical protein